MVYAYFNFLFGRVALHNGKWSEHPIPMCVLTCGFPTPTSNSLTPAGVLQFIYLDRVSDPTVKGAVPDCSPTSDADCTSRLSPVFLIDRYRSEALD